MLIDRLRYFLRDEFQGSGTEPPKRKISTPSGHVYAPTVVVDELVSDLLVESTLLYDAAKRIESQKLAGRLAVGRRRIDLGGTRGRRVAMTRGDDE